MAIEKHILILANSIRHQHRCVAGRELIRSGEEFELGPWVRLADPRSERGEVQARTTECLGYGMLKPLDIARVQCLAHCHDADHPEDWWFKPDELWEFAGRVPSKFLKKIADEPPSLWTAGDERATVPAGYVRRMGTRAASLYLIKAPPDWSYEFWKERISDPERPGEKKEKSYRRLRFDYAGHEHEFSVTDPDFAERHEIFKRMIENKPQVLEIARRPEVYFCLSLTPELNNRHYKVCATILEPDV